MQDLVLNNIYFRKGYEGDQRIILVQTKNAEINLWMTFYCSKERPEKDAQQAARRPLDPSQRINVVLRPSTA